MRNIWILSLVVVVIGAGRIDRSSTPTRAIPLVMATQNGTEWISQAWQEGKDDDAWIAEAQSKANDMGEAIVVTQGGRLIMMVNPRPLNDNDA